MPRAKILRRGIVVVIRKKRIRSVFRYFASLQNGQTFLLGIPLSSADPQLLKHIGFSDSLAEGERVLPTAMGPVTRFNAEGKYVKHRGKPMETAYRQVEWHWVEWHGPYRVEQSRIVDVPYQRYPRTFVPPPSLELSILINTQGSKIICSPSLVYSPEGFNKIIHATNLFLELFGECHIYTENLDEIIRVPVRRLNWDILPPGRWPWSKLRPHLKRVLDQQKEGNRVVIEKRLETINAFGPEFVAIGRAGFEGYIVFGFPEKSLFVLESMQIDNATYVFGEDWETLSQLTKAEVLDRRLHRARFIHRQGWFEQIKQLLA